MLDYALGTAGHGGMQCHTNLVSQCDIIDIVLSEFAQEIYDEISFVSLPYNVAITLDQ